MDDLEAAIATRLKRYGDEATPPRDLPARVLAHVATTRRRRWTVYAIAAAVAAIAIPIALLLEPARNAPIPPTDGSAASSQPPGVPIAPPAPQQLDAMVDRANADKIPVRLEDRLLLSVAGLGPTGIVVGRTGFDSDPFRATDRQVWLAGSIGEPRPLAATPDNSAWAYAVGDEVAVWAEHRDETYGFQVICSTVDGVNTAQISETGVSFLPSPVHVDANHIVWTDEAGEIWMAENCEGTPEKLQASGLAVAFSYPDVVVLDPASGELALFDTGSGVATSLTQFVLGQSTNENIRVAANQDAIAWSVDEDLFVFDRHTGQISLVTSELPTNAGVSGALIDLTLGDDLLVYSRRPMEGPPTSAVSYVHDLDDGTEVNLSSEAFAAGALLVWREGTDYLIASSNGV